MNFSVIALISRTQQRGTCTRTRNPGVPMLHFDYEYHFIEYE